MGSADVKLRHTRSRSTEIRWHLRKPASRMLLCLLLSGTCPPQMVDYTGQGGKMEAGPYHPAGLWHAALGLWDVQRQKRPPAPVTDSKSLLMPHFCSKNLRQAQSTHQMRR